MAKRKNKLSRTQFFGDGDSNGFNKVENTYKDEGVNIVKKECVRHVQKRVRTALRNLEKGEKKDLQEEGNLQMQ